MQRARTSRGKANRIGCVAVVLAAVLVATCSGSDGASEPSTTTARRETWFPDLAPGESVQLPEPPNPNRRVAAVVAGDGVLFLFGGHQIRADERIPVEGGAVLRPDSDEWSAISPPPFSRDLFHAAVVWTGAGFVVVGEPCGATDVDLDLAGCGTPALEAAVYDPKDDDWTELPAPPVTFDSTAPLEPTALGWTGKHAVFRLDAMEGVFAALDPVARSWEILPDVDVREDFCFVGRALYGVQTTPDRDDVYGSMPPRVLRETPIRLFRLDAERQRWEELAETAKPDVDLASERVECGGSGDALAYVPVGADMPVLDGVLVYDPDSEEWTRVVAPQVSAFGRAGLARIDDRLIWWPESGESVLQLDLGGGDWTSMPKPGPIGVAELLRLGDVLVARMVDVHAPLHLVAIRPAGA